MSPRRNDLVLQEKIRASDNRKRKIRSISLSDETWNLVSRLVETGAGKFGSALVEHSIRFFIACLTGNEHNINISIEELEGFVITPEFSNNLRKIADSWDERKKGIDL